MNAASFDQFAVFVAIVDEGSFAAAAKSMNRAHSAITYAIQKLEDQTGALLFDRSAYRPVLTEAGIALLPRARRILDVVAEYHLVATGLAKGVETEVRLVIDPFIPMDLVTTILKAFHETFPTLQVRLMVEPVETSVRALMDGWADVAITVDYFPLTNQLERSACGLIELVAVAAPAHPLARIAGPIEPEVLRDHLQLILAARPSVATKQDHGIIAVNRWYTTELETKHAMLLAGLGWGSMPRSRVAADIAAGKLVELHPTEWDGLDRMPQFPFVVARRKGTALGTAGRWLVERLSEK